MEYNILLISIIISTYLVCNIYWHKKIVEGKWIYTIYSTFIVLIWILFVSINFS